MIFEMIVFNWILKACEHIVQDSIVWHLWKQQTIVHAVIIEFITRMVWISIVHCTLLDIIILCVRFESYPLSSFSFKQKRYWLKWARIEVIYFLSIGYFTVIWIIFFIHTSFQWPIEFYRALVYAIEWLIYI